MQTEVILEKQDLTYLKWSHVRSSGGTAGTFLKSKSVLNGEKKYYKLSNFDPINGVTGHECVNEIIVDRLLNILGVEHIHYQLINAAIEIEGRTFETFLCCSDDFKRRGESKTALDNYYAANALKDESHFDFCVRQGWKDYIEKMLAVDHLILNRDRHGANIEVLRNPRERTVRLASLFDHGLSLLYSCVSESDAERFNVMEDRRCQNFIGSNSTLDNLNLIGNRKDVFPGKLKETDKAILFESLETIIPGIFIEKIWEMVYSRYERLIANEEF